MMKKRNYDASWMIPDEEAEYLWEQRYPGLTRDCSDNEQSLLLLDLAIQQEKNHKTERGA